MRNIPNLLKKFPMSCSSPETTELQFLMEDIRRLEELVEKYEKATSSQTEILNCGCKVLNGVLLKWCGEHYL